MTISLVLKMVELKEVDIKRGANRYMIHIPKALIEDSDVLKMGKKYRVSIEEVQAEKPKPTLNEDGDEFYHVMSRGLAEAL